MYVDDYYSASLYFVYPSQAKTLGECFETKPI